MRRDDVQDWSERRDALLDALAASLSEDERQQFAAELSFVESQIRRIGREAARAPIQPSTGIEDQTTRLGRC